MTLVPIIYTSLLIFSALLLFVIFVSYISYKAKGGSRKEREIRNEYSAKQIKMKNPPINVSSNIVINNNHSQMLNRIASQEYSKNIHVPSQPKVVAQTKNYEMKQASQKFISTEPTRKLNRTTIDDRISVLNTSNSYYQSSVYRKEQSKTPSHRLPDLNILNYYSDKGGSEFITLSA